MYEKSKIYLKENFEPESDHLSSKYVSISAITCKALTSLLTYPHEVVRARQQDARTAENMCPKLSTVIRQIV